MLASHGPKWFDRRRPEHSGPSIVVSFALTALLFASAFTAMRRVGAFQSTSDTRVDPPVVVRLTPPPPARRPDPALTSQRAVAPANSAPTNAPRGIPSNASVAPVATPNDPQPVARDTATRRSGSDAASQPPAAIPVGVTPLPNTLGTTPMATRGGAPVAPSGVTIGSRTANTERYRDSVINLRLKTGAPSWMDAAHAPKGAELQDLRSSQEMARKLATRTTSAGSREVHVMQGEGRNGEGAVGGANPGPGTVGLPLFSPGPSAAQRRKNEKLDADYQLRLRRLQDRLLTRQDSLRADSLRRDSLARKKSP